MFNRLKTWLAAQWWVLGLVVVAVIILFVIIWQKSQPESVLAYQIQYQDAVATTTVTGEVKARTTVIVSPPISAKITSITVDDGDHVAKGQVLLTLDEQDVTANLATAASQVSEADAALRYVRQGARQEEIARFQATVQEAQSAIRQAQAGYHQAQSRLDIAQKKARRMSQLYQDEVLSTQEYEQSTTERDVAQQEVNRLQAEIKAAQFRQQQAQQQLRLAKNGPTQAEVDRASAAKEAARNSKMAVQDRLSDRTIKSNIDGVVLKRIQDPGEMAIPGQPVMRLADWKTIEIVGLVEEADLSRVKLGDKAYVLLDADPDNPLPAKITRLGAEVNPENGTLEIAVILLPEAQQQSKVPLMPGMTADINIITEKLPHSLVIPSSTVTKEGRDTQVYVFDGDKLTQRKVKLERVSVEYFKVLSGLKPDEIIARFGSLKLLEKRHVQPSLTALDNKVSKPPVKSGT